MRSNLDNNWVYFEERVEALTKRVMVGAYPMKIFDDKMHGKPVYPCSQWHPRNASYEVTLEDRGDYYIAHPVDDKPYFTVLSEVFPFPKDSVPYQVMHDMGGDLIRKESIGAYWWCIFDVQAGTVEATMIMINARKMVDIHSDAYIRVKYVLLNGNKAIEANFLSKPDKLLNIDEVCCHYALQNAGGYCWDVESVVIGDDVDPSNISDMEKRVFMRGDYIPQWDTLLVNWSVL